jgi:hypothetical protein
MTNDTHKRNKRERATAARAGRTAILLSALMLVPHACAVLVPRVCAVLVPNICSVLTGAETVFAADALALTVKQSFTASAGSPPSAAFDYLLAPVTQGAPLPEGAGADGYAFSLSGNAEHSIDIPVPIEYGVREYTLRCVTADRDYYTRDGRVYELFVYVYKNAEGKTDAKATVKSAGNEGKLSEILFSHLYARGGGGTPDPPGPPDTGEGGEQKPDDTGGDGGEPEGSGENPPEPSKPGGKLLPSDNGNYIEVDENGVPLGEWRYDPDTNTWIYDEYPPLESMLESLPQTGQLQWPVPVLAILGALSLLAGRLLGREKDAPGGKPSKGPSASFPEKA